MTTAETAEQRGGSLELAILGSGAAFSAVGHNAGYLIDRALLLDCGAPVTSLMGQMGRGLDELKWIVISHLHGDHFAHLPLLVAARAARYPAAEPLRIIGPLGTAEQLDTLGRLDLGSPFWNHIAQVGGHRVEEWSGGQSGAVGPFQVQAVEVEHSAQLNCLGFRLERHGITLGYSGDTSLCPGIRELAGTSDYLLCECTGMEEPAPIHLWRAEVEELIRDNPNTRFILTHLSERSPVPGAVLASDGLILKLRAVAED
ncbi:MAG TPA: MBL fold metallo-hydrolase [Candidatus Micrarchaeaceae archaeon]|nr:MBL fold metallo-hydrolase [Candidatus Micrarchaeaceae archaeon]